MDEKDFKEFNKSWKKFCKIANEERERKKEEEFNNLFY